MKKLFTLMAVTALAIAAFAQSPQKMSYQCVVRNSSGALVPNQAVGMKISILKGSSTGTVIFSETYSPNPQTNANGLVTLEIGSGTASVGIFSSIDWSAGPYFMKTETDPAGGTSYTITGTSQLLSVPYALYAKTAANGFSGAWADLTGKPAFATVATSGSYNDLLNKPVLFDGTWNSLTGKPAGFTDGIDNVDDADNSITNEIQALNLSGTVLTLSNGGGSVTLPSSGGGDNWGTQTVVTNTTLTGAGTTASPLAVANTVITPSWSNVQGIPAGFADGTDNVDDADNSITNEIQTLNLSGTTLSLSSGGGSVTLPSSGGGDNWGTQTVATDATLAGNGTIATPLRLAQQSAANGQLLKWNGTNWSPGNDLTGEFTLPYSGTTNSTGAGISVTNSSTVELSSGISGYSSSTTNRTFGVTGRSASSSGVGVYGSANSTTGTNYGVIGYSLSTSGLGVFGQTSATTGKNYGVYGQASSNEGTGVYGNAIAATGITNGVYGISVSTSGRGVVGHAYATSGINYGVYGLSKSNEGYGVFGQANKYGVYGNADATDGYSYGVYGVSGSLYGYGVYGKAISSVGETYGVYGISETTHGFGVSGVASATSGMGIGVMGSTYGDRGSGVLGVAASNSGLTYGIQGESRSSLGTGIYGLASSTTGTGIGVYGKSLSTQGYGVKGEASATTGINYGIFGETASELGFGVFGIATSSTGTNCGVYGRTSSGTGFGVIGAGGTGVRGETNSSSGYGLEGVCFSSTGVSMAVRAIVTSSDGFSGYFDGGKFYVSGNTGIGIDNPGAKLEVAGQVKITGGSPGAGKVLTSDASGLAAWATPELILPYTKTASSVFPLISLTNSGSGNGILAISNSATGITGGVIGEAWSTSGSGIIGTAWAVTGINYGVRGKTQSVDGFSGYFDGGRFYISGKTGIGRADPVYKLDVMGDRIRLLESGTNDWIALRTDGGTDDYLDLSWGGGSLVMQGTTTNENIIMNPSINKVGIRTWNPQYELDVTGDIRATGSVYYGGTAGAANGTAYTKPDYVFKEDYSRLSINEVNDFLRNENHLPWITSAAKEKEENGEVVDMTRMAFETVESVENLQLQIIEMDKQYNKLKDQIRTQQREIDELKSLVSSLISNQSAQSNIVKN